MSNRWLQTRCQSSTRCCSYLCPIWLPFALSSQSKGVIPRRQKPSHGPAHCSRFLQGLLQWPTQGLQTQSRWQQRGNHASCQWPRKCSWQQPPHGGVHEGTRGGPCDDLTHRLLVLPPQGQVPQPERAGLQLHMIETTGG